MYGSIEVLYLQISHHSLLGPLILFLYTRSVQPWYEVSKTPKVGSSQKFQNPMGIKGAMQALLIGRPHTGENKEMPWERVPR